MRQIWVAEIHELSKIRKDKQREFLDRYWESHDGENRLSQLASSQSEKVPARQQL